MVSSNVYVITSIYMLQIVFTDCIYNQVTCISKSNHSFILEFFIIHWLVKINVISVHDLMFAHIKLQCGCNIFTGHMK